MTAEGDVVTLPWGGLWASSCFPDVRGTWYAHASMELLSAGITAKVSAMRPLELSEGANADR